MFGIIYLHRATEVGRIAFFNKTCIWWVMESCFAAALVYAIRRFSGTLCNYTCWAKPYKA